MSLFRSELLRGTVDSLPFHLVTTPFGLIFGVIATEAGLHIAEVMGFSVLVIAGASQLTALHLMTDNAPTVIVVLSALAVNLRMAMYSASLLPHIGATPLWMRALAAYMLFDQPYAMSMIDYEKNPDRGALEKITYFFGVGLPIAVTWTMATWIGAVAGDLLPAELGLEFAVPITFIAIVAPMLRTLAHVAAALTSVLLTLAFAPLPFGTGLLVAAGLAIVVGASVESWGERRRARA